MAQDLETEEALLRRTLVELVSDFHRGLCQGPADSCKESQEISGNEIREGPVSFVSFVTRLAPGAVLVQCSVSICRCRAIGRADLHTAAERRRDALGGSLRSSNATVVGMVNGRTEKNQNESKRVDKPFTVSWCLVTKGLWFKVF